MTNSSSFHQKKKLSGGTSNEFLEIELKNKSFNLGHMA
jgi:hypothetical protein